MRGCFSLLSKEHDLGRYGTGIFVASAEDDVIARVLPTLPRYFPHVSFTFVVAKGYAELFSSAGEILWLEDIKASPTRWLAFLRKRRFDLCIVLCVGRPTYRKTKLAALLLNARRTIVYNEYGDSFLLDRAHWKALLAHVGRRAYKCRLGTLLFPIGLIYLACRTLWLSARARYGVHG